MAVTDDMIEAACKVQHSPTMWGKAVKNPAMASWVASHRAIMRRTLDAATEVRPDTVAPECWSIVEALRAPEGAEVCLFCDNPDVGMGANNALEVCDDWTEWRHVRFEGDTILEALRAALRASKGAAGG